MVYWLVPLGRGLALLPIFSPCMSLARLPTLNSFQHLLHFIPLTGLTSPFALTLSPSLVSLHHMPFNAYTHIVHLPYCHGKYLRRAFLIFFSSLGGSNTFQTINASPLTIEKAMTPNIEVWDLSEARNVYWGMYSSKAYVVPLPIISLKESDPSNYFSYKIYFFHWIEFHIPHFLISVPEGVYYLDSALQMASGNFPL